jgi:hypothetical protein
MTSSVRSTGLVFAIVPASATAPGGRPIKLELAIMTATNIHT